MRTKTTLSPIHPGEILLTEFMAPYGLSAYKLAKHLEVPITRVTRLINGQMGVTADTASRLGALFGMTAQFWINLQARYDARIALREADAKTMRRIEGHRKELALVAA